MWTSLPAAATLLASLAARPPATRIASTRYCRTTDHETVIVADARVRRLRAIYKAAEPAIDTRAWRAWLVLTPDRAIREAVAGAPVLQAAE